MHSVENAGAEEGIYLDVSIKDILGCNHDWYADGLGVGDHCQSATAWVAAGQGGDRTLFTIEAVQDMQESLAVF